MHCFGGKSEKTAQAGPIKWTLFGIFSSDFSSSPKWYLEKIKLICVVLSATGHFIWATKCPIIAYKLGRNLEKLPKIFWDSLGSFVFKRWIKNILVLLLLFSVHADASVELSKQNQDNFHHKGGPFLFCGGRQGTRHGKNCKKNGF